MVRAFHVGRPVRGLDEFFDEKKPNETVTTGRAWTVADVRRKVPSCSLYHFLHRCTNTTVDKMTDNLIFFLSTEF